MGAYFKKFLGDLFEYYRHLRSSGSSFLSFRKLKKFLWQFLWPSLVPSLLLLLPSFQRKESSSVPVLRSTRMRCSSWTVYYYSITLALHSLPTTSLCILSQS
ncbi:hypothetical protein M501DRAFT_584729 [Patellaria atrata CBS 101060]|uniref:Uncharacterized protein n=1 Tax=Patellaria atrata CBS 101060 TaxID=1346257 RepID=A0A9P4VVI7_9PEZI|nr:hypothetical protein M501DRAFT_584729 [Patellaria atrata CBS 101060]